jgi:O-antigen ligase
MALRVVAFVVICLAAFSSESESAKLALMAAAVSYPLFFMLKSRSIWVLGALVLASLILMPLAAPYVMSLIPDALESRLAYGSVGLRADIWAAHASLLINAPVFGHGMDASFMAAKDYSDSGIPDLFLRWGHPHNFSIQVWYELGVTGIVLFAVLIAVFFRSLKVVPAAFLPALLSTVVAVWTVSLVSHGAWQAWWWCLGGLLCLMWLIALKGRDGTPVTQTAGKAVV